MYYFSAGQFSKKQLFVSLGFFSIMFGLLISPVLATSDEQTNVIVRLNHPRQQESELDVNVTGTSYVNPNGTITYTAKIENVTNKSIKNIQVSFDLPEKTTYVSGGSFDQNTKTISASIPELAGKAKQERLFVVKLTSEAKIDTVINLKKWQVKYEFDQDELGYSGETISTRVEQAGELVAIYKNSSKQPFTLGRDDYSFENFGNEKHTWKDDLSARDLFQIFGPKVCQQTQGATIDNCQLTGPAQKWLKRQLKGMNGGHCEGMAVTSLRFFEGLSFNGNKKPNAFQQNAASVSKLTFPEQKIENYIAHYFVYQVLDEVYSKQVGDKKPSEILNLVINSFKSEKPTPYTVGIFKPGYKEGHAIIAYGVEKLSETVYRILVYDNNYPNQRKYITIDTNKETWEYFTSATPSKKSSPYRGDAKTKTLFLSNLYNRELEQGKYFSCPFCTQGSNQSRSKQTETKTVDVSFSGEGAILVVNADDQAVGYDFNKEKEVNEIPEAELVHNKGGLGKDIPPIYQIPYPAKDEYDLYAAYVSNKVLTGTTDGMLSITGERFVIGVDYLQVPNDEYYDVQFSRDGSVLSLSSSTDVAAPAMFVSYQPITITEPSIIFEIDGAQLDADEIITVTLNSEKEWVYFDDSLDIGNEFTITLTEVYSDGYEETFSRKATLPTGSKEAYIDFGIWNGEGPVPLYIDGKLVEHVEEPNKVYLPIVIK